MAVKKDKSRPDLVGFFLFSVFLYCYKKIYIVK
jgi:hypothetical protein